MTTLLFRHRGTLLSVIFLSLLLSCSSDNSSLPEDDDEVQQDDDEVVVALEDKLPQFFIDTKGGTIVDEPKISSDARITIEDEIVFEGNMGIEFRGATSQTLFPKKSYGLETWDENNEDINVALLGFPEEEDWILQGPYSDKSLVRNKLIYDVSRGIDMYASRTLFVDLTINGTYQGVYVFMEKLKRDSNRIDINKLKDDENSGEDLTGGYILKIDKVAGNNVGEWYNELNSFVSPYFPPNASTDQEIYFLYEYPDAEDITTEQKGYIAQYMTDFENALASDDFTDPDIGYQAYIDVDSFIDFFILNEFSNNVDGYRLSTFMYKDKNEKLKMGPIWDFNLAFGNADYCDGGATDVWAYKFNERCPTDFWLVPFWWNRLLEDPTFVARLKERWSLHRSGALADAAINARLDAYVETLDKSGSLEANFASWPVLGTYIWPNLFIGNTYDEEMTYLRNWISDRTAWLDTQINQL